MGFGQPRTVEGITVTLFYLLTHKQIKTMKGTIKSAILMIAFIISGLQLFAQKQDSIDNAKLKIYFVKHNIRASEDQPLGIYFTVSKVGKGKEIFHGNRVKIKYRQRVFTTRMKYSKRFPNLNKAKTISFRMNKSRLPKWLQQGVCFFPKGTKATLYIPSGIAYGTKKHGSIKPNSILVYDVQIFN